MPQTSLEERIAGLEGSYKELTKGIDDLRSEMHRGFDGLRTELNGHSGQIAELRAEQRSNFRWIMSLILVNWLSFMAGLFLVARR